jgi:hypothetical protein
MISICETKNYDYNYLFNLKFYHGEFFESVKFNCVIRDNYYNLEIYGDGDMMGFDLFG